MPISKKSSQSSKSTKSTAAKKKKRTSKPKKTGLKKSEKPSSLTTTKKPSVTNRLLENASQKAKSIGSTTSSKIDDFRERLKQAEQSKKEEAKTKKEKPGAEPERPPLPSGALNVLLSLPFQVAGEQTGYHYEIPKRMQPIMETVAQQTMEDFGPEVAGKWLNLAVFVGCYGHCFLEFRKGLKEHAEKMIELEKLKKGNA